MARKLLRENYAKIVNYKPFSIKLKVDIDEPYEKIVDPATKDSTNG